MPNTTFQPGDKIPLKTAEEYTKHWRNAKRKEKAKIYGDIKGFLIPKEDIEGLYRTKNADGARAYLGLTDEGEFKLIMVAVQKINETDYRDLVTEGEDDADIYDFTRPCPNQCDCESPLNGGTCEMDAHVHEIHEAHEA